MCQNRVIKIAQVSDCYNGADEKGCLSLAPRLVIFIVNFVFIFIFVFVIIISIIIISRSIITSFIIIVIGSSSLLPKFHILFSLQTFCGQLYTSVQQVAKFWAYFFRKYTMNIAFHVMIVILLPSARVIFFIKELEELERWVSIQCQCWSTNSRKPKFRI